jgi:hypothetical protein
LEKVWQKPLKNQKYHKKYRRRRVDEKVERVGFPGALIL